METQPTTTVENPAVAPVAPADPIEVVPRDDHKRAIEDMHKFKRQAQELADKLKAKETDDLKKTQQWQQLAELKEQEAKDAKTEAENLKRAIVADKKYSAVREYAITAGLRKEAIADLDLVDLDDVSIETTSTGRVNVSGVDKAVARLKLLKPHWFKDAAPQINAESPGVTNTGGSIDMKQLDAAEKHAKKTGDYTQYKDLLLRYKSQLRG